MGSNTRVLLDLLDLLDLAHTGYLPAVRPTTHGTRRSPQPLATELPGVTSVRRFYGNCAVQVAAFLKNDFHLQKNGLTSFAKNSYKGACLMHEIFILHIKTFDSKWVCFRPLADGASPVTNQMLSRVERE